MNLDNIRAELDDIDTRIVELLNRRRQLSREVAVFKAPLGLEIYQPQREEQILSRVRSLSAVEPHDDVAEIYALVLEQSRKIQQSVIGKLSK